MRLVPGMEVTLANQLTFALKLDNRGLHGIVSELIFV